MGFFSLQETIDTTTPGGRLVFHVFSALAQFERDLVIKRTTAGLVAARGGGAGSVVSRKSSLNSKPPPPAHCMKRRR
ncbi:MAG: recombinase family protein [Brevibacterium aurantiacum]